MKYWIAINKGSGKKVIFKTKKAMDAAIKAHTHDPLTTVGSNAPIKLGPNKSKGKAVFGNAKPKKVFQGPDTKSDGSISMWDRRADKVVTFKTKADWKKADKEDKYRYDPIYKAKGQEKSVSSVITNGPAEAKFYDTMSKWTRTSDMNTAKQLTKMRKVLDLGKEQLPAVFKPDIKPGKPVFRGLRKLTTSAINWIKKTKKSDWKRVKVGSEVGKKDLDWFIYQGPIKTKFEYKPHRPAQSWTKDVGTAMSFAEGSLLTLPVDDSFYFSSKYMNTFGYSEDEVIRLGDKTKNATLLLNSYMLGKLTK